MRAVVIATGVESSIPELTSDRRGTLLPFIDRPFIQHVVERLVVNGITHIEFVLHDRPEAFEALLGTGERWGCKFRFHLVRDPLRPYAPLRFPRSDDDGHTTLLVHADTIPLCELGDAVPPRTQRGPRLFGLHAPRTTRGGARWQWSGCAWLTQSALAEFPVHGSRSEIETWIRSAAVEFGDIENVDAVLSIADPAAFVEAQGRVMELNFAPICTAGRLRSPGVRVGRNVHIHRTAIITPPVYIGENSRIDRGARLGPNASVGPDCVVDRNTIVVDAAVLPGTYVGEGLEIRNAIAGDQAVVSVQWGAGIAVPDDLILSSVTAQTWPGAWARTGRQLAATLLLLPCGPLLLATALWLRLFRSGPVLYRRAVVRTPSRRSSGDWQTFRLWSFRRHDEGSTTNTSAGLIDLLTRVLPALVNVARGELHFVGLEPRSVAAVRSLPDDWREIVLSASSGIIAEAHTSLEATATRDDLFAAEVFQAATPGMGKNLRRLTAYLRRSLRLHRRSTRTASDMTRPAAPEAP